MDKFKTIFAIVWVLLVLVLMFVTPVKADGVKTAQGLTGSSLPPAYRAALLRGPSEPAGTLRPALHKYPSSYTGVLHCKSENAMREKDLEKRDALNAKCYELLKEPYRSKLRKLSAIVDVGEPYKFTRRIIREQLPDQRPARRVVVSAN